MSNKNDGGPAFPQHGWSKDPEIIARMQEACGVSQRDYFAAKAMEGWIASFGPECQHPAAIGAAPDIARFSYMMADAMLVERSK